MSNNLDNLGLTFNELNLNPKLLGWHGFTKTVVTYNGNQWEVKDYNFLQILARNLFGAYKESHASIIRNQLTKETINQDVREKCSSLFEKIQYTPLPIVPVSQVKQVKLDSEPIEPQTEPVPISSEQVRAVEAPRPIRSKDIGDPKQAVVVQEWLNLYQNDFVAHAIWETNVDKVIRSGEVLPAEAVLLKNKAVEYEGGALYGERGVKKLKPLTAEDIAKIESLSPEEEARLVELRGRKEIKITPEEKQELTELAKILEDSIEEENSLREQFNIILLDFDLAPESRQRRLLKWDEPILNALTPENKQKWERAKVLIGKYDNFNKKMSHELRSLERRKVGIHFSIIKDGVKLIPSVGPRFILAFDQLSQDYAVSYRIHNAKRIYTDLAHKYEKWKGKIDPRHITDVFLAALETTKLNASVRAANNAIRWDYGNCVVLRGKREGIISHFVSGDRRGGEAVLLHPWENKGDYFTLPLAEEHTMIIGPRKDLEPHAEELGAKNVRFAYLESLTKEQADMLRVPDKLRTNEQ